MDCNSYTIGWVSALSLELAASRAMLDKLHEPLKEQNTQDKNNYCLGEIGGHNVVMACLPSGRYGIDSAATVASNMLRTFPCIKMGLMVGIGGGVPSDSHDIRLGDVVVSKPDAIHGGVVNYDTGKLLPNGVFEKKGHLSKPPLELLNALSLVISVHEMEEPKIEQYLTEVLEKYPKMQKNYSSPGPDRDVLYKSECEHEVESGQCVECQKPQQVIRERRQASQGPKVHYGLIGSGTKVVASIKDRERLKEKDDIICFEMEAAGLMDNFPCLVIRGISDYADSYKRDEWQPYAALAAAAYAKELLQYIPHRQVVGMQDAGSIADVQRQDNNLGLQLLGAPQLDRRKFVGRHNELQFLKENLLPSAENSMQRCVVIQGLGGVGKTQLSVQFANQFKDDFSSIIWLKAHSESNLKQSFISLMRRIEAMRDNAYDTHEDIDETKLLQQALAWLSQSDNSRWLLIFDNYDTPLVSSQTSETGYDVSRYFPYRQQGSILVTTQSLRVNLGPRLLLKKFGSSKVGLEILAKRSNRESILNDPDAERLVLRLDGLALALATAGDYLCNSPIRCIEYLNDYERFWEQLGETSEALPEYEGRTLYNTWNMSLEKVSFELPEARQLMQFFAYFGNQKIWFELLVGDFSADDAPIQMAWHNRIFENKFVFRAAMRKLHNYALVEMNQDEETYILHSCVYDWVNGHLNRDIDKDLYILAVHCTSRAPASNEFMLSPWEAAFQLECHATWLTSRPLLDICQGGVDQSYYRNLGGLGRILSRCGELAGAEEVLKIALEGCEKTVGSKDYQTLSIVEYLGNIFLTQERLVEAESMYQRALEGYMETLGPDHWKTLVVIQNVGRLFLQQKELTRADEMFRSALDGLEKKMGRHHQKTLEALKNLGLLLIFEGRLEVAEEVLEQNLSETEKALGTDHLSTLNARIAVGDLYRAQNRLVDAEAMTHKALSGCTKVLGPNHPRTMYVENKLSKIFMDQGKAEKAVEILQGITSRRQKALGPVSPETLRAIFNLAAAYEELNELADAETWYKRSLEGYIKVYRGMLQRNPWAYRDRVGIEDNPIRHAARRLLNFYCRQVFKDSERNFVKVEEGLGIDPWTATSSRVRHCLLSMIDLHGSFPHLQRNFGQLGRCLIWILDKENALIAFQQQIMHGADGLMVNLNTACDGCKSSIKPISGRFVCVSCHDVDLCQACYSGIESGLTQLKGCHKHSFLEVVCGPESKWGEPKRQAWLHGLQDRFDEAYFTDLIRRCCPEVAESAGNAPDVDLQSLFSIRLAI